MRERNTTLALSLLAAVLSAVALLADPPGENAGAAPTDNEAAPPAGGDWLVTPAAHKAEVKRDDGAKKIVMANGLVSRTWRIDPNAATVALDNLMTGESLLRGVKPEARIELDGVGHDIGGLVGQPDYAYLSPEWMDKLKADPKAFRFAAAEVSKTKERFAWRRTRRAADLPWPPPGASLTLHFKPPADGPDVAVEVHYEMYDGLPLLAKWLTVRNNGKGPVRVNRFTSEVLAVVEAESAVDARDRKGRTDGPLHEPEVGWLTPGLHVESDYHYNGMDPTTADRTTHWVPDPQYATQVNFLQKTPAQLESRPPIGPDAAVAPSEGFETFRTFELVYDATDRERRGLALRRMYRTLAPWVTENPIQMHVRSADPAAVREAVDQCAEVGFEMVILSFGSGFDMENDDPAYLAKIKELVDYARGKGVELGGYSLLASRSVGAAVDVVNPPGGPAAVFGASPCLATEWGANYFRKLRAFHDKTGLSLIEHDGSYPGDVCASTKHAGHRGLDDSQWTQWKTITDFYAWCRGEGVYLNVPDFYFLNGSNKCGMGYNESVWSLPRARQVIHGCQNIYDGTWEKTPSMGWMFVPLTEYHGGGAAATIEPLADHLDAYDAILGQNFGCGVQAAYRGPRLYDCDETKAVVKKWVTWYKLHRDILESDVIHVRRADGRDVDCLLHVNPRLKEKGLAMVFNPLDREVEKTLKLPLYYTGLTDEATVRERDGDAKKYKLDRRYDIELRVKMEPRSLTWFVVE